MKRKYESYYNICVLMDFSHSDYADRAEFKECFTSESSASRALNNWATDNEERIGRDECGNITSVDGYEVLKPDDATFFEFA